MNFTKDIAQGAATSVFCCVSNEIIGGKYYSDCNLTAPQPFASDASNAVKLWEITEKIIADCGF